MIRQGRLFTALLLILSLTGCGGKNEDENGPKRWASFPIPIYMDGDLENAYGAEDNFYEAMSFWEARAGKKLFDYRGVWQGQAPFTGNPSSPTSIAANIIFILDPWSFSSSIAGQTVVMSKKNEIRGSIIMLNPSAVYCFWSCPSEKKIFTHELGHFLGFDHSQEKSDIMYPEIQGGDSLDSVTINTATLSALTQ